MARIPADHLLRKIDRFFDLSTLRQKLTPFYSPIGGHGCQLPFPPLRIESASVDFSVRPTLAASADRMGFEKGRTA